MSDSRGGAFGPTLVFNLQQYLLELLLEKTNLAMHLEIDDQQRILIPLKLFRAQFNLPDEFGCTFFEKKDWIVGSLNGGGDALVTIKKTVVKAVPETLTLNELLHQPEKIANTFRTNLESVNSQIGLTPEQLDYAADGLHNALSGVVYELARLHQLCRGNVEQIQATFDFASLYQSWLNQSVSIFGKSYKYEREALYFEVKLISYIYGRVGLRIETADEVYYVADSTLACPAAGFMGDLTEAVAMALCSALTGSAGSQLSQPLVGDEHIPTHQTAHL